jgi:hypothetical protein
MQSVEQTLRDLHSRLEELDSAVDNGEIEFTGLHKLEK